MSDALRPAQRMGGIQPFHVMSVLGRALELESQGRDIVHMEIGEPDFPTPEPIVEAGHQALRAGRTFYTASAGIPPLREAIAAWYQQRFGLEIDPARVIVTPGASGALQLAMGILINPGEQLLMADPGYPCNPNFLRHVSGVAATLPVGPEQNYQLKTAQVEIHWSVNTRGVLLASPANPTGTLVTKQSLASIYAVCKQHAGALLVDEIYQGLVYDREPSTALCLEEGEGERLLVINSFSKYFQMTGWRLGWLVVPKHLAPEAEKLAQNLFLSAPTLAQYAALAAFKPETIEILEARRETFQKRRDVLIPALRDAGFDVPVVPEGAFYVYADASRFTDNSYDFALSMLQEAGVAVAPGRDFGVEGANHHLRFAYTAEVDRIEKGVRRIQAWLN